jgi:hypothetical protein
VGEKRKITAEFRLGELKKRKHLKDVDIVGR